MFSSNRATLCVALVVLVAHAANATVQLTDNTKKPILVASPCDTDEDCNAPHGMCVSSANRDGLKLCMCRAPWYGPDCTNMEKQAACDPPCRNGGYCTMTTTPQGPQGVCVCKSGFLGADCTSNDCPNKCNGHGVCQIRTGADGKANGKCFCNQGFAGHACSRKVCPFTPNGECDGAGQCIRGDCKCREGYFGRACTKRECVSKCSGHGVCTNTTFACDCDPGFVGLNCERAVCPKTKEGTCSNHGACDSSTGKCKCDALYTGVSCSYKKCNGGKVGCSGHGRCEDSKCICDVGYVGVACESHGCPMNCLHDSGHGECDGGECNCYPGYGGLGCERKLSVPQPCGDECQTRCLSANPNTCEVSVQPSLAGSVVGGSPVAAGGKFPGAKCYQQCLWGCVRGCFSELSPASARAEADHWNDTAVTLGQWQGKAMEEFSKIEGEWVSGKGGAKVDDSSQGLEQRVKNVRKVVEYVDALKAAADKEVKRSEKMAALGNKAEAAVV